MLVKREVEELANYVRQHDPNGTLTRAAVKREQTEQMKKLALNSTRYMEASGAFSTMRKWERKRQAP